MTRGVERLAFILAAFVGVGALLGKYGSLLGWWEAEMGRLLTAALHVGLSVATAGRHSARKIKHCKPWNSMLQAGIIKDNDSNRTVKVLNGLFAPFFSPVQHLVESSQ